MAEQLMISIGIGLGVSLLFSELFGLTAGGLVVPGYFALFLTRPLDILLTLAAALITFTIVRLLSAVIIIYGRRRTVITILIGYLAGIFLRITLLDNLEFYFSDPVNLVGFIIPGLIAIWLERQGVVETITTLISASVVVRLILIITIREDLPV